MNTKDFIDTISPYAILLRMEGSPMFPSVRIAQNILETGRVIHPWFNLGGIKVGAGKPNAYWHGDIVNADTWEVYNGQYTPIAADFRSYDSLYDFYHDQDLLFLYDRYERVRAAKNPQVQAEMLRTCGYATDPQYPTKLKNIIFTNGLERFDREVESNMKVIDELKKQLAAQEDRIAALEGADKQLPAPVWFIKEFGENALVGIVNDPIGDVNFWRNTAVTLREK